MMFCPGCGEELQYINREKELAEREMEILDAQDKWYLSDCSTPFPEMKLDLSVHLECCNSKCYLGGTVLIQHHPFKGIESRPGGSWSLSWIK